MARPPQESSDFYELAGSLGLTDSFQSNKNPSSFGYGTRQSKLPNNRTAKSSKKIMRWLVPEGPIVEMYLNPQSVSYPHKKIITSQRVAGGFNLQYWGEDLIPIRIAGTTGTSGIEGINVLYDVYRNEQLAFDPYALYLEAQAKEDINFGNVFGGDSALSAGSNFVASIIGGAESLIPTQTQNPPSLASLAFTVELYWDGWVFRGYFTDFSVNESADRLGLFDYDITFVATQRRGFRQNFLAWHRSAVDGHVNSDPRNGTPYSFGSLIERASPIPSNE